MSHRRSLLDRAGRFNEMVWLQEDFDLWKRMARAGAKFSFVSGKSGIYHVRPGTLSQSPRLTPPQRGDVLVNWQAGRSSRRWEMGSIAANHAPALTLTLSRWETRPAAVTLAHTFCRSVRGTAGPKSEILSSKSETNREIRNRKSENHGPHPGPVPKGEGTNTLGPLPKSKRTTKEIAFLSTHCVIDFNSDAARAALDGLTLLARFGFECQAFCGTNFAAAVEILTEEILAQRQIRYQVRNNSQIGPYRARMIFAVHGKVPLTLFNTFSTCGGVAR